MKLAVLSVHHCHLSIFYSMYLKQTVNVSLSRLSKTQSYYFGLGLYLDFHLNVPNPSIFQEPTRIELTPKKIELMVGESIVLSCKALHDSTLDVTFYWTLNGQPIDFEKEGGHFESIKAVSDHVFVICVL